MKRYTYIAALGVIGFLLNVDSALSQRAGGGAGAARAGGGGANLAAAAGRAGGGAAGAAINRSPSLSRPAVSQPAAGQMPSINRPATGQLPSVGQQPSTPSRPATGQLPSINRPSVGQLPSQQPSTPNRPSFGQLPATNPGTGASPRPSLPAAGTLPAIDRGRLEGSIGIGAGQRPAMPDWFTPGVSPLPSQPSARPPVAGQLPSVRPPSTGQPPVAIQPMPPIAERPVTRPPVTIQPVPPITRPPATTLPVVRPPVVRPPVVGYPPIAGPPRWPWYAGHPSHPIYRPNYWWRWATPVAVTGWVVHRWAAPIYYRYGSGGNIYYQNNMVYIDGQQYCSADQYYQQASTIVSAVPAMDEQQAEKVEWLPLGVFAITSDDVDASNMYLQLAISKDGMIAGTFYNETTGTSHPVEGMVDQATQRAVWKATDGTNAKVIMETGIYNLTEDKAPVLVHFGPDQTQTALLVRLDEPEQSQPAAQ